MIRVFIGGAVALAGWHELADDATLGAALLAVGGLSETKGAPPAGVVTVRRPGGWGIHDQAVFKHDVLAMEPSWKDFALADGDSVVFQFKVG